MSKATEKQETTEFPTFDAAKAAEQFRTIAERNAEQTRETFERMRSGAEDTRKAFEASFEGARNAGDELVRKSIAAVRTGTEVNLAQFDALMGAKSLTEVMELQTGYLRKQMELATEQAKDFQTFSQKTATQVSKPVKDAFDKAFNQVSA